MAKKLFSLILFALCASGSAYAAEENNIQASFVTGKSGTTEPTALFFTDGDIPTLMPGGFAYMGFQAIEFAWFFHKSPWFEIGAGSRAAFFYARAKLFNSTKDTLGLFVSSYSARGILKKTVASRLEPNVFVDLIVNYGETELRGKNINPVDYERFNESAMGVGTRLGIGVNYIHPLAGAREVLIGYEISGWINSALHFKNAGEFQLRGVEQYFRVGTRIDLIPRQKSVSGDGGQLEKYPAPEPAKTEGEKKDEAKPGDDKIKIIKEPQ